MILVVQIAAGIVLGGLTLWLVFFIFSNAPTMENALATLCRLSVILVVSCWALIHHTEVALISFLVFAVLIALFYAFNRIFVLKRRNMKWINLYNFAGKMLSKVPIYLWPPLGIIMYLAISVMVATH